MPDIDLRYCEEHYREYQARQQEKIETEDLDSIWSDRLSTWRNPPPELIDEPFADRLWYRGQYGDWLVFIMGYTTRTADWLAIHVSTSEIRRFVELNADIADILLAGKAARYQLGLPYRWGRQESWLVSTSEGYIPWYKYFKRLFKKQLRLIGAIDTVPFPVYGPTRSKLRLALHDVAISPESTQPIEIRLFFASVANADTYSPAGLQKSNNEPQVFSISSARVLVSDFPLIPSTDYTTPLSLVTSFTDPRLEEHLAQLWQEVGTLLHERHEDLLADTTASGGQMYRGLLEITDTIFTGDILHWPERNHASVFLLRQYRSETNDISRVTGWSFGIPMTALIEVLRGLVELDKHGELLMQYQAEWDDNRAWDS
jgi:hypothetical protein